MPAALCVPNGHRRTIERLIGMSLSLQHLPQLHGDLLDGLCIESREPVELGTVGQGGECSSKMCLGVAIEVPFAGESRPPAEDREGDDLATTERGIRTYSAPFGLMRVAKFIDDDVKCGEEGVHVEHEQSVPFPSGLVSKPTLVRGHLPLKSSMDNSHQAFKGRCTLYRAVRRSGRLKGAGREHRSVQPRDPEEAAREVEPQLHVYGPGAIGATENRGYARPGNRSPLELVVNAPEGFIPLWAKDMTLRWRFQERSLAFFEDPEAAKTAIRELLGEALLAWGDAAPVNFAERDDAWDFEVVMREADRCNASGCV